MKLKPVTLPSNCVSVGYRYVRHVDAFLRENNLRYYLYLNAVETPVQDQIFYGVRWSFGITEKKTDDDSSSE